MSVRLVLPFLLLLAACGGAGAATDAGGPDSGNDLGATDAGPVDGPRTDATCSSDADGDGHRSIACGGDDCDDNDSRRYPGNTEVCDSGGLDEDCDPSTLGTDADHDGFVSDACCNTQVDGSLLCGTDCADHAATINPSAVETCNGVDDDCNGMIDETGGMTWYLDFDMDGFGDATRTMHGCTMPAGYVAVPTDCDDTNMSVHPGATEIHNGIDDNCNRVVDEMYEVQNASITVLGGGVTGPGLHSVRGGSLTFSAVSCNTGHCVRGGIDP